MKSQLRNRFINICLAVFFLITGPFSFSQSQTWQWAKSAIGSSDESINSVTTDALGNVYAAGYFYGSTLAIGSSTLINQGNYDFFVIKFDPSGTILWAKSGGGIYDEVALGITTDLTGNVYVTGYFYSPSSVAGNFTLTNNGVGDIFVIKYSSSGTELWAKGFGGNNEDNGNSIACDPAGNLLVTGFFKSATMSMGITTLTKTVGEDVFIFKMDSAGNPLWAKSFEGSGNDRGNGIRSDTQGNIYITGYLGGANLILGADTLTNSGSSDAFLSKLSPIGTAQWSRSIGGQYNDVGNSIATDPSGNVFVTGTFNSFTITAGSYSLVNHGGFDFFVAKYNSSGTILWANVEGGIFDDTGYAIIANNLGDVFVTGHYHSPSIILGNDTLNDEGIGDLYLVGYDNNGKVEWSKHLGGTADDGTGALACDAAGNLIIGGYFISPILACNDFTLTNTGNQDLLVAKLKVEYNFTSIPLLTRNSDFLLFPNPNSGIFQIKSPNPELKTLDIYDEMGRNVYHSYFSENTTDIDLSMQAPGIYVINVSWGERSSTRRMIRQ